MSVNRLKDILSHYKSRESGLSDNEVLERLRTYGLNSIQKSQKNVVLKMLGRQFTDLMVIILLIAGTLAFIFASYRDAGIMFLIVATNAAIGFFQEFKVEKTLSALGKLLPKTVRVMRANNEKEIISEKIVPGDIIMLSAGEDIPADCIILEGYSLKIDEGNLTGESHPVDKMAVSNEEIDDANRLFMGTTVLEGSAKVIIEKTGFTTRFGKIAHVTSSIKNEFSPLQKKLNKMSKLVARIALLILAVVIIYGVLTGKDLVSNFLFALALAAAVVPEGLPATVSVALSIAANRLAQKNALVKKLTSTEALGAATVICTDKTGTITEGRMKVKTFWNPNAGETKIENLKKPDFELLVNTFALCSHAGFTDHKLTGNYNETSLLEYLVDQKIDFEKIRKSDKVMHEITFSSTRKMMSVIANINGEKWLLTKGLPERVIEICSLDKKRSEQALTISDNYSSQSLHNLAFAYKRLGKNVNIPKNTEHKELEKFNKWLEKDLQFLGILGLSDPVKNGVVESVADCHKAGIKIMMITGDSGKTALAVAHEIGMFENSQEFLYSGQDIDDLSDVELRNILQKNSIFAEINPEHKLRIVENLQAMGEIVAVTGDGVNDAPALKKADIGISMGHKGTDVAKEAADMILLDDNFSTIVKAIYEGRTIFDNIQKIVYYVFASNAGELLTLIIGVALNLPLPIIAVQILAIDLGTDVLPSLTLAFDKGDKSLMTSSSEHKSVQLLNKKNLLKLLITGLVMGVGANISFYLLIHFGYSYGVATTASYTTIVLCQIVSILLTHLDFKGSLLSFEVLNNKYLILAEILSFGLLLAVIYLKPFQYVLQTQALNPLGWAGPIITTLIFLMIGQWYFLRQSES